jgi:hypothetical protein
MWQRKRAKMMEIKLRKFVRKAVFMGVIFMVIKYHVLISMYCSKNCFQNIPFVALGHVYPQTHST